MMKTSPSNPWGLVLKIIGIAVQVLLIDFVMQIIEAYRTARIRTAENLRRRWATYGS
jgi:hypothetical protein